MSLSPQRRATLVDWPMCTAPPDDEQARVLRVCLASEPARVCADWAGLARSGGDLPDVLARGHPAIRRLLPSLHEALVRQGIPLGAGSLALMRAAALWERHRARRIRVLAEQVLAALCEASVGVVVLKGLALSETVYPVAGLRHCHDLDLLVGQSDLLRASSAVLSSDFTGGGSSEAEALHFVHRDGLPLRVHARLPNPIQASVSVETVLERAGRFRLGAQEVRMQHPVDVVLHIAAQLREGTARDSLTWILDLAHLLARSPMGSAELALLCELACRSSLLPSLRAMFELLDRNFAVGADVLAALSRRV